MATNTYVALDTKTISIAATSIEFTSIPQGYTDLVLSANVTTATDGEGISFQVGNGSVDTTAIYSRTLMSGANDNGVASFRQTGQSAISMQYAIGVGSNQPSVYQVHFMNYSSGLTYKTFLVNASTFRGTSTNKKETMRQVGLWRSNSAIDTIKVSATANFNVGSTFTLYGIANSDIGAPKAFGGTITQDANYTYHTFGASGTFTPQQSLTCDYLVVAGGGSGAKLRGAGGGAGGLRTSIGTISAGGGSLESTLSLSASDYTITVGAGGAEKTSDLTNGNNGNNSSIAGSGITTVTSTGGGGGATYSIGTGSAGGSGGGATFDSSGVGGAGTANQGFAGGLGAGAANYGAGGGGGAGVAGTNGTTTVGGNGGNGVLITALSATGTGVSNYYAGGGGGATYSGGTPGTGGSGGGGAGVATTTAGGAGITNSGGGGGGGGYSGGVGGNGGAGGSGIVIIRYAN